MTPKLKCLHRYPDEVPDATKCFSRGDLIAFMRRGSYQFTEEPVTTSIFYRAEDAAHDHSIWQDVEWWAYQNEFYEEVLK